MAGGRTHLSDFIDHSAQARVVGVVLAAVAAAALAVEQQAQALAVQLQALALLAITAFPECSPRVVVDRIRTSKRNLHLALRGEG